MINWKDNIQPEPPFIASIFHYYLSGKFLNTVFIHGDRIN